MTNPAWELSACSPEYVKPQVVGISRMYLQEDHRIDPYERIWDPVTQVGIGVVRTDMPAQVWEDLRELTFMG